ncbi:MAG: S41 family peptidase [Elusimicrobiota bacterium]
MKTMLSLILSLVLLPQILFAQELINGVLERGDAVPTYESGPTGFIAPAKYKAVENPGYVDPDTQPPPNLKLDQVKALLRRMAQIEMAQRGENADPKDLSITQEDVNRLVGRLAQIDRQFVDPIAPKTWDLIFTKMGEAAEKGFDVKKKNWPTTIDTMLKAAVKELKNPHTVYWNKEEFKRFQESMKGTFAGIGVTFKKDGTIDIVFPDSPAAKAGLKGGDKITSVDGKPVEGKTLEEIRALVRGESGTDVRIGVNRNGKPVEPLKVTRGAVQMRSVMAKMVDKDTGYVYFTQFGEEGDTDKQIFDAVKALQKKGAKKLILDVRGNPGGSVGTVSSIASEFLPDGAPIVSFKKQGQEQWRTVTDGKGMFADMPVVALVDGGSASASEILAGAFQDHMKLRPVIIGSQSYGKGSAQSVLPEKTGQALKITGSRWFTPNDRTIDAKHDPETGEKVPGTGGVKPDVSVEVSDADQEKLAEQRFRALNGAPVADPIADPVIEKAIEVLKQAPNS